MSRWRPLTQHWWKLSSLYSSASTLLQCVSGVFGSAQNGLRRDTKPQCSPDSEKQRSAYSDADLRHGESCLACALLRLLRNGTCKPQIISRCYTGVQQTDDGQHDSAAAHGC